MELSCDDAYAESQLNYPAFPMLTEYIVSPLY